MVKGKKLMISGLILFLLRFIPWYPYSGVKGDKVISLATGGNFCNGVGMAFVEECNWFYPLSMSVLSISLILIIIGAIVYYKNKRESSI